MLTDFMSGIIDDLMILFFSDVFDIGNYFVIEPLRYYKIIVMDKTTKYLFNYLEFS